MMERREEGAEGSHWLPWASPAYMARPATCTLSHAPTAFLHGRTEAPGAVVGTIQHGGLRILGPGTVPISSALHLGFALQTEQ